SESGLSGLEPDGRAGSQAGQGQRNAADIPLLAPTAVHGAKPVAGVVAGPGAAQASVSRLKIPAVFVADIAADEPAYGAADEDIGREVLAAKDAGEAYAGGQAVCGELRQ